MSRDVTGTSQLLPQKKIAMTELRRMQCKPVGLRMPGYHGLLKYAFHSRVNILDSILHEGYGGYGERS